MCPGLLHNCPMAGVRRRAWGSVCSWWCHPRYLFAYFSVANPGSRMCRRHPGRWSGGDTNGEKYLEKGSMDRNRSLLIQSKQGGITRSWSWRRWEAQWKSSTHQPGTFIKPLLFAGPYCFPALESPYSKSPHSVSEAGPPLEYP